MKITVDAILMYYIRCYFSYYLIIIVNGIYFVYLKYVNRIKYDLPY